MKTSKASITKKWADSGLLRGTPKSRQGRLASLLELTSSIMQEVKVDGRAGVFMFPLIVRLYRNHPELEPILNKKKEISDLINHFEEMEFLHLGGLYNLSKDLRGIDPEVTLLDLVERSYVFTRLIEPKRKKKQYPPALKA